MNPPNVLVVDDDMLVLAVIQASLARVGLGVVACTNAFAAVEKLKTQAFDLVLTDYNMPGANGSVVVAAARQFAPETPVTIMTGDAGAIVPDCLQGANPADVLNKPFDFKALTAYVRGVIERRSLQIAS